MYSTIYNIRLFNILFIYNVGRYYENCTKTQLNMKNEKQMWKRKRLEETYFLLNRSNYIKTFSESNFVAPLQKKTHKVNLSEKIQWK